MPPDFDFKAALRDASDYSLVVADTLAPVYVSAAATRFTRKDGSTLFSVCFDK